MLANHFQYPDTLIIIFAREPVQGQVKTRLIPSLGEEKATELYRRLLMGTLTRYSVDNSSSAHSNQISTGLAPVSLCLTPESRVEYFQQLSCTDSFNISCQKGNELGARMYNALLEALETYDRAILIGTDCPFFTVRDAAQAIEVLNEFDMVFAPANDGGYVMVGASRLTRACFTDIDWGTEQVMSQTRERLRNAQLSWFELPQQVDIDTENDLKYLMQVNEYKDLF